MCFMMVAHGEMNIKKKSYVFRLGKVKSTGDIWDFSRIWNLNLVGERNKFLQNVGKKKKTYGNTRRHKQTNSTSSQCFIPEKVGVKMRK